MTESTGSFIEDDVVSRTLDGLERGLVLIIVGSALESAVNEQLYLVQLLVQCVHRAEQQLRNALGADALSLRGVVERVPHRRLDRSTHCLLEQNGPGGQPYTRELRLATLGAVRGCGMPNRAFVDELRAKVVELCTDGEQGRHEGGDERDLVVAPRAGVLQKHDLGGRLEPFGDVVIARDVELLKCGDAGEDVKASKSVQATIRDEECGASMKQVVQRGIALSLLEFMSKRTKASGGASECSTTGRTRQQPRTQKHWLTKDPQATKWRVLKRQV